MQEVSIDVSPPMDPKKEEQGKEKQRRAQELLSRIHTNKQRVSITILLSKALNYLPSATLCKIEIKSPGYQISFYFFQVLLVISTK